MYTHTHTHTHTHTQERRARFRVVSLQGHLIDTSGTMSGGGNKVMRGGMSSRPVEEFSSKDIAKFESDLQQQGDRLVAVRKEKSSLETKVCLIFVLFD